MSQDAIDAYEKDVGRVLLRENLKLKVQERFDKFNKIMMNPMAIRQAEIEKREAQRSDSKRPKG